MGRQATTKGLMSAAGDVKEMEGLLRDGIELQPSDSELAAIGARLVERYAAPV